MAIYCSFPNCKNGPGNVTEGIGFYKFPLEDTVRLQQWLKNMDCEKWTPCHQDYICEEHFSASCFIVQWGVRYLCNEAVPTVFHKGQKRKATYYIDKKAKQPRVHIIESIVADKMSDGGSLECSVGAYPKQVQDGLTGESSFPVEFLQTDQSNRGDRIEVTYQALASDSDEGEGDDTESDEDSLEWQQPQEHCCRDNKLSVDQLQLIIADLQQNVKVLQQREHQQLQTLVVLEKEVICLRQTEVLNEERLQMLERNQKQKALNTQYLNSASERFSTVHGDQDIQLTADFETVPFTFPSNSAQRNSTVDTVLTSALSSTSTLPILSNHVPPMPEVVVIRDYGLDSDSDEGEGDYRKSEEIIMECHLEVVIADLQKTVKVLQQQDRQRLEKCMGLENAVSQLEQNNEMTDVRLQLLEKKRKATDYIENPPKRRRLDSK